MKKRSWDRKKAGKCRNAERMAETMGYVCLCVGYHHEDDPDETPVVIGAAVIDLKTNLVVEALEFDPCGDSIMAIMSEVYSLAAKFNAHPCFAVESIPLMPGMPLKASDHTEVNITVESGKHA